MKELKILAKDNSGNKSVRLSVLLATQLFDVMPLDERRAFIEDGEVLDTAVGRKIFALIRQSQRGAKAVQP